MTDRLDRALEVHRALLERWRKAMDLVGPGPTEPHFEDARVATTGLNARGVWADLGSGAGFPGIALAARFPEAMVWLVESRQKRAAFLETVVHDAELDNARVVCQRVEALDDQSFDGVIARAFRPPEAYLADAHRLVRNGGVAVLMLTGDGPIPAGADVVDELAYAVGPASRRRLVVRIG